MLSPSSLNLCWLQGVIDTFYLNPFTDPLAKCPYAQDSQEAEMWHYGAQWTMAKEGVTLDWRGEDQRERGPEVDIEPEVGRMMKSLGQAKEPIL